MKIFKPTFSDTQFFDGSFYISCRPAYKTSDDLKLYRQQHTFAQRAFLAAIKRIISEDSNFEKVEVQSLGIMLTYNYKGSVVLVFDDDFQGILISSLDRKLIETIFAKLNSEDTPDDGSTTV